MPQGHAALALTDFITPGLTAVTAIGAVVATWQLNRRESRRKARADRLREQLEGLYGELAFLITTNRKLLEHADQLAKDADDALAAPKSFTAIGCSSVLRRI